MDFEFDEAKSQANLVKQRINFVEAQDLWLDPKRVEVEARSETEPRFAVIARRRGKLWTAICTTRGNRVRIISVRRSRHGEEEGYCQC
jgi:uncharacterized DUF497 family protein